MLTRPFWTAALLFMAAGTAVGQQNLLTIDGPALENYYADPSRIQVFQPDGTTVVAEYRYDGEGKLISWHTDENGSSAVSTADPVYWKIYDDRWRPIAIYRCGYDSMTSKYLPDSTAKMTCVYHNSGLDGRGGSSYIDSVILRDRDANGGSPAGWLGASDGVLEERFFYGQNQHADVSLVMNNNGRPFERIKYSAYGVATVLTDFDFNGGQRHRSRRPRRLQQRPLRLGPRRRRELTGQQ